MKTMKKIFNRILTVGLLSIGSMAMITSCDYLDQRPENLKTSDMIWETRTDAEAYLYNIYGYIWLSTDDPVVFGFADETSCVFSNTNVRKMVEGNWGPSNTLGDNKWGAAYRAIQKALIFEQNIDRVPEGVLSTDLKIQYKAESRFLRGWFYWNILRLYGPFVIFDKPVEQDEDFNKYVRRPFDECVEYVCGLMESTLDVLPEVWTSTAYLGRPTKGTALAVISQVRLLAASELWNGNPRFKDFKNKDGELLAPQTEDREKWRIAAEAAEDVIDLGIYHLYRNTESGDRNFDPYLSFRELFMSGNHAEVIFATHKAGDWQWGYDKRCNPKQGGYSMQNATQNIVDAFLTRDGLDIHDDENYTEAGFAKEDDPAEYGKVRNELNRGYRKGESNMYVNREPRFYASVHYNGRPVLSAITVDDRNYFSSDKNKDGFGRAEYYYSGSSGAGTQMTDFTGYNVAKKVSTSSSIRNDQSVYRPYIHIRYAEILLNYMEAMNEYNPEDSKIISYFNEIRDRAGIPKIIATYPQDLGNKEKMREWILRERQIELAFEGDRFWTLARRLLYEKEENRKIYRMNVLADDQGQGFGFEGFYERTLLQTRYWDNKMYLYPISQTEIDRGRGLVQNPRW